MNKSDYTLKIVIRYSIIQLPGLVVILALLVLIQRWIYIPLWISCSIIIVWVIKDVILFFFTWKAYDWDQRDRMIGMIGTTLDIIDPEGNILVHGEKWKAESVEKDTPIEKCQNVIILGRKGLILKVKTVHDQNTTKS